MGVPTIQVAPFAKSDGHTPVRGVNSFVESLVHAGGADHAAGEQLGLRMPAPPGVHSALGSGLDSRSLVRTSRQLDWARLVRGRTHYRWRELRQRCADNDASACLKESAIRFADQYAAERAFPFYGSRASSGLPRASSYAEDLPSYATGGAWRLFVAVQKFRLPSQL